MAIVRVSADVALDPAAVFDALIDQLTFALARAGMSLEGGAGGRVLAGSHVVGAVRTWQAGEHVAIEWHPADWSPDVTTAIDVRLEPLADGTRVSVEHSGVDRLVGAGDDLAGWFAGEVAAPFLRAAVPGAIGDWLTDRHARRPSGAGARAVYQHPIYHYPNFHVILEELALAPSDYLLEVGCGGGALLKDALRSGCRAAAVDHSPDMVRLAREQNREAVGEGRLSIQEASADALPFAERTFTCAAMTGVLGFLPDPVAALAEMRRVLRPSGRAVVLGSDPELKGTPAAPEPMASRLRFYDDDALADLALRAGFADVRVIRRDLEPFAREGEVPREHLALFKGDPGARFLLARRR